MFDPKIAQQMAKEFVDSLHPSIKAINQEIETHLRQFLETCFQKMDLVTRQEFDIQTKVLEKTRLKLDQMERTLKQLESQFTMNEPSDNHQSDVDKSDV